MYSRVWEGFALGFLDVIKATIGMQEFKTTDDLAKLNRAYWEAIGCEVEEVETTPDRLVADHQDLPVLRQHGRHVRQGGGQRDDEEDDRRRPRRTTTRR